MQLVLLSTWIVFWIFRCGVCEYEMMLYSTEEFDKEGVLLMNISSNWSYVSWTDDSTLKTVCNLLGYGYVGFKAIMDNMAPSFPLLVTGLSCTGNESRITECDMVVDRNNAHRVARQPGIHCFEYEFSDLRLIGGLSVHQGYVQVKMNDRFGYVCGQYGDRYDYDSDVICRSFGYPGSNYDGKADGLPPLAIVNTSYVIPDSKYWVDRRYVNCTGAETNLSDCKIGAVLVYMTGCNRETMFVDCTECDEGYYGIHCDLCPCVTEHTESCNLFTGICTCDHQTGNCTCRKGWTGKKCDADVDECLSNPCVGISYCQNTPGSFNCLCPFGYTVTSETGCYDIDECKSNPCTQQMNCTNIPGSYVCECMNGYHLVGGVCTECSLGSFGDKCDPCKCVPENTEGCNNTENVCACEQNNGSCYCKEGWVGHNCDADVDECVDNPCEPNDECVNTVGSYLCQCRPEICYFLTSTSRSSSENTVSSTQPVVYALIGVGSGIVLMCIIGLLYKIYRHRHSGQPDARNVGGTVTKTFHGGKVQSHDVKKNDTYASIDTVGRINPYMDLAQRSRQDDPYFPICNGNHSASQLK